MGVDANPVGRERAGLDRTALAAQKAACLGFFKVPATDLSDRDAALTGRLPFADGILPSGCCTESLSCDASSFVSSQCPKAPERRLPQSAAPTAARPVSSNKSLPTAWFDAKAESWKVFIP